MTSIQHDPPNVNNPEHLEHHVVGPKTYAMVFGTLLLCTLLTVLAAKVEMGVLNAIVALAIACFKAVIVILFFILRLFSSPGVGSHRSTGRIGIDEFFKHSAHFVTTEL